MDNIALNALSPGLQVSRRSLGVHRLLGWLLAKTANTEAQGIERKHYKGRACPTHGALIDPIIQLTSLKRSYRDHIMAIYRDLVCGGMGPTVEVPL